AKQSWKAVAVGIGRVPGASTWVWLVSSAAITAPALVVPSERIREFTPTLEPDSLRGTLSITSVGIAAYPMPTPEEATIVATISCHGASISPSATPYPPASTTAPAAIVSRGPSRVIIRLETGAITSIIRPAGAIHTP